MSAELRLWLDRKAERFSAAVIQRAPTLLPDQQDVLEFINLLVQNVGEKRDNHLSSVQHWVLTTIGHDAAIAYDWLTILRVLKQEISADLAQDFSLRTAFLSWSDLDSVFTLALIETAKLASDSDRASVLQHMADLRREIDRFEQSKSNFIAVSAHELRTPLTILEGYANMLRFEVDTNSRSLLYIDGLENGIQRMKVIINDLIDISLIDLQSIDLSYQPVDLGQLVAIVGQKQRKYFDQRKVTLIIEPFEGPQETYGDPEKLAKAFTKLLANAIKYTPDGGRVTITGKSTPIPDAAGDVVGYTDIQITDNGIGINPEQLEMIFGRFTTTSDVALHSSSKTSFKGGGPGLGLPIVRGIMEAHGGQIWAESTGCDEKSCPGSTFHIELPIRIRKPEAVNRE